MATMATMVVLTTMAWVNWLFEYVLYKRILPSDNARGEGKAPSAATALFMSHQFPIGEHEAPQ